MGKELVVKEQPEFKPQYGGRSLVEKVTAYRLSDGELVESKEAAVRRQKALDKEDRIDMLIEKYLEPFEATAVDSKGVLSIEGRVVSLFSLQRFLYYCDEIKLN